MHTLLVVEILNKTRLSLKIAHVIMLLTYNIMMSKKMILARMFSFFKPKIGYGPTPRDKNLRIKHRSHSI
jgi:hypothetical protein